MFSELSDSMVIVVALLAVIRCPKQPYERTMGIETHHVHDVRKLVDVHQHVLQVIRCWFYGRTKVTKFRHKTI
jgi:hypothetical protein